MITGEGLDGFPPSKCVYFDGIRPTISALSWVANVTSLEISGDFGTIHSGFGHSSSLQSLCLVNCCGSTISNSALEAFSRLTSLEICHCDGGTGTIHESSFQYLSGLVSLRVTCTPEANDLHDSVLLHLSNLETLKLDLWRDFRLTGATFYRLRNLTELDLGCSKRTIEESALAYLTNLKILSISSFNITGSAFRYMPNLTALCVKRCTMTDSVYDTLSGLSSLRSLSGVLKISLSCTRESYSLTFTKLKLEDCIMGLGLSGVFRLLWDCGTSQRGSCGSIQTSLVSVFHVT
eukprot:gb/GECG01012721.1/.p1 GENE.gb/GECG01012721.1/~~gb/GECG01012721.1/.p1  ORF type:complete len:292 (+),score=7.79 gb/GECG01012721.1/:1-876(+)